ncbi:alpha- and gamma-adaptin-binding protein p34-like [Daphnia pulicaria]|uniref:alpha- and gamma-adaptin-binding protein p34-like n=1 Tax=Daphnia pulicaria TaxID=35523 RepID=UPI001EEB01F8|nr:alpha- and gamma-adaptin-binding protein p34-like [Daphnia pulicaria]
MNNLPICLVIGVDSKNPEDVIKGIMGHLPSVKEDEKGFSFYQWDISNKYYDASIHFCQMTTKMVVDEDFSENVNASIIFFNSLEENGLKKAEEWIPFLNEFDLGVKILVCDQCSTDENSKHTSKISAQQWCIRHGFELVELDPLEKPDPDDDFPETLGTDRIIQALHAHSWPNLELKSGEKSRMDHLSRLLSGEDPEQKLDHSSFEEKSGTNLIVDRQISEGIDSFEELFQAMSLMKSQASTLQGADRKAYAEKMTMAFWQAIEGSPEEIEGLDSSEDEG